jgi:hypothetical protein
MDTLTNATDDELDAVQEIASTLNESVTVEVEISKYGVMTLLAALETFAVSGPQELVDGLMLVDVFEEAVGEETVDEIFEVAQQANAHSDNDAVADVTVTPSGVEG